MLTRASVVTALGDRISSTAASMAVGLYDFYVYGFSRGFLDFWQPNLKDAVLKARAGFFNLNVTRQIQGAQEWSFFS